MFCANCGEALDAQARFCSRCGTPAAPGGAPPGGVQRRDTRLVLWIVIPIVLAGMLLICGIIAAIAIPNFLNAVDRGKQKRSMADLDSIAAAIEAYSIDHGHYPIVADLAALKAVLEPTYIRVLPELDPWGQRFQGRSSHEGYFLLSTGKDGIGDGCDGGPTGRFDADICLSDGQFIQWPEGLQR